MIERRVRDRILLIAFSPLFLSLAIQEPRVEAIGERDDMMPAGHYLPW